MGHLMSKLYYTPPENWNQQNERITREVNFLKVNRQLVKMVVQAKWSKSQLYLERNWEHVERYYV